MLCDKYSMVYTPSQQLALDEGMLAWRGCIYKLLIYDGSGMKLEETVIQVTTALLTPRDLQAKQTSTNYTIRKNKRDTQIIQSTVIFPSKRGNYIRERTYISDSVV
ncbi:hypothetical protein PR048_011130 [Dryococelus australis]|uniref:Uncharacterized protein n=1 Tax=Dryococelus australis TaxID=614101 RepID=A0ABQ9HLA4_9NEOP|nr:hypothetical protein PR048_011130 [Dryococelus australis]